jgi:hypothetical protein
VAAGRAFLRELSQSQHYHSVQVKPTWRHGLSPIRRIGQHIFYNPIGRSADLSMVTHVVQRWDEPGQFEMLLDDGTTVRQAEMTTTATASTTMTPKLVAAKRPVPVEKPAARSENFNPFADGGNGR